MSQTPEFALRFENDEVRFLICDHRGTNWQQLLRLPIDAVGFDVEMKRFCTQVIAETGKPHVAVLLPEADIMHDEVSLLGNGRARKESHAQRTLARCLSDRAENVVVALGPSVSQNRALVAYALKETLLNAANFIARYGFKPRYFSPARAVTGFTSQPRLLEDLQLDRKHTALATRLVRGATLGAATGMAAAFIALVSVDTVPPYERIASLQATPTGFAASFVAFTPKPELANLDIHQIAPMSAATFVVPAAPKASDLYQPAGDSMVWRGAEIQRVSLNDQQVSPHGMAAVRVATADIPDETRAFINSGFQGGFSVSVGRLKHLTFARESEARIQSNSEQMASVYK